MQTYRMFVVCASVMGLACAGCGTITPDTTLQELLTASGLGDVTVGEVASAIQEFTGNAHTLPFGVALTDDQQAQISDLEAQLRAGTIPADQFKQQVQSILGVSATGPGSGLPRFGGGGHGPDGARSGGGAALAQLNLTDDQKTQAQTIFDNMRADILKLQQDAKTQIDAVLTDDQRQQLDSLPGGLVAGFRFFHGVSLDSLATKLGLTDDQKSRIQTILTNLHAAIDARRQQARDEFRAILTADQQAILDQWEAAHPKPASASTGDSLQ